MTDSDHDYILEEGYCREKIELKRNISDDGDQE